MIMLNGFLRGLWVGLLAAAVWAFAGGVIAGLTGWEGITANSAVWVFVIVGIIATWAKVIKDSSHDPE